MTTPIIPLSNDVSSDEKPHWLDKISRKLILKQLAKITHGEVVIRENGQEMYFGGVSESFTARVHIDVNSPGFWSDVAFGGSSGAGEAYIKGSWKCNNLTDLVRVFLRNREVLDQMDERMTRFKQPLHQLIHGLRRNTRSGSRKNISAHYDLGNDFFKLFLDQSMMYSSAIFKSPNQTLDEASVYKLDRICKKLSLSPQDHLLEIGTGWGGMAIHAAKNYGCRVTTTTISREQYELAKQRVADAGLEDRVTLLLKDYRDLAGEYDKIVSIEMVEAIGHQYLNTYFEKCCSLLKDTGLMCLQAITIKDQYYKSALREVDFIKKFIFPGGFLPSVTVLTQAITRSSEMNTVHLEDIGCHYATTLEKWRDRFHANMSEVKALGYPDTFVRMWDFYFSYCEGGFIERDIGTVQMLLSKPANRTVMNF